MDCDGCLEGPDEVDCRRKLHDADADEATADVLCPDSGRPQVGYQSCDRNDEDQLWNLKSVEPAGIWYQFENKVGDELKFLFLIVLPTSTIAKHF